MITAWDVKRIELIALMQGKHLGEASMMILETRESLCKKVMSRDGQEFKRGDWVRYPHLKAHAVIPAEHVGVVVEVEPDLIAVKNNGGTRSWWEPRDLLKITKEELRLWDYYSSFPSWSKIKRKITAKRRVREYREYLRRYQKEVMAKKWPEIKKDLQALLNQMNYEELSRAADILETQSHFVDREYNRERAKRFFKVGDKVRYYSENPFLKEPMVQDAKGVVKEIDLESGRLKIEGKDGRIHSRPSAAVKTR
jgi:hypothetical protein